MILLRLPFCTLILLLAFMVLSGCQHSSTPFHRTTAPTTGEMHDILQDLRANHALIESLRVSGRAALSGPDLDSSAILKGLMYYQKPGNYYLEGRKMSSLVVRMAASGEESLLELFHDKLYYHYKADEDGELVITPEEILREVLFGGDWANAVDEFYTLRSYDPESSTAELVNTERGFRRVLKVVGTPWVITESSLYDENGVLVAHSKRDVKDRLYPSSIEAEFPESGIGIHLVRLEWEVNKEVDKTKFDIPSRLDYLESEGYVEGVLGEVEVGEVLP